MITENRLPKENEPNFTQEDEEQISNWIETGVSGSAWDWMTSRGDPGTWKSRIGRTIAGRLFNIRGNSRQSDLFHLRCLRDYPEDPEAIFYGTFRVHQRFGPWRALATVREAIEKASHARDNPEFASLYSYLGSLYSTYRDFDRAWESQNIAENLKPDDCWIRLQRSCILLDQDKPEKSLAEAEDTLALRPRYRAVIASVADAYWNANRDDDAFELLQKSLDVNDSPDIAAQLARFYDETGQYENGLNAVAEYEKRSPMADDATQKNIAQMRANFLYLLDRGEEMVALAEQSDHEFYKNVGKRVKSGEFAKGQRKVLDVKFVRQNDMTCSPATLTGLAGYWGNEATHLEVADEICYDGTSSYKERLWAEKQGWLVCEFTADESSTRALIDAGIPYALATVEPTSAHLQAVIGYDSRTGAIVIRDPGSRHYGEVLAAEFFENYSFSGPRAMLAIPKEEAHRLDKVELPDAALFDIYFELQGKLDSHDRDAATRCWERMKKEAQGHRLTEMAEWSLCAYDGDLPKILPIVKRLTEAYPEAIKYRLDLFRRYEEFQTREERIKWLRAEIKGDAVLTLFYKEIADLLSEDARQLDEAMYYYRRAMTFRHTDPETLYGLAGALWDQCKFDESTELYRFASCLNPRNERFADSYFKACRCTGDPETGLAWLRKRFDEFASFSPGPAITLCKALEILLCEKEEFEVLEKALNLLPEDGELLLFAAEKFGYARRLKRARKLLKLAKGKASRNDFLRLTAKLASLESDPEAARTAWSGVLETEPFAMDAYRAIAQLTAELEGIDATVERLEKTCKTFPDFVPLQELYILWLKDKGPGSAEGALRDLVKRHPSNAWAIRQLALELSESGRCDEAMEMATQAITLQPNNSVGHSTIASIFESERNYVEAGKAYRKAIELDVENTFAMQSLVKIDSTDKAQKAALVFIENELTRQTLLSDGMSTFREVAYGIIEPEELLEYLKRAHAARPDLWQTWNALIEHQLAMHRPADAQMTAISMTEKFPMSPRAWYDLSTTHCDTGQVKKEISALEKALELNPQWSMALRQLSTAYEKGGDTERAIQLLKRAVEADPLVPMNHGCLADALWKKGDSNEAFESVKNSLKVDPDYAWGWETIGEWGHRLNRSDEAIEAGERLTRERPADPDSWTRLSTVYSDLNRPGDEILTLQSGIENCPRSVDLHDFHAVALVNQSRFSEAIQACNPECFKEERVHFLQGREAWVEWERGNQARAIELLQEAVEDHSSWIWAFEKLSDWYVESDQLDEAIEATQHLIRLNPMSPQSHGCMADLMLKKEQPAEAIKHFSRAFQLSPTYKFAAWNLTLLKIEAEEFDQAKKTLEIYEYHNPGDCGATGMRVRFHAAKKEQQAALTALETLANCDGITGELLISAEQTLEEAGWGKDLAATYYDIIRPDKTENPVVVARWVAQGLNFSLKQVVSDLKTLEMSDTSRNAGWRELVIGLSNEERKIEAVRIVNQNREIFRSTDTLWATAGYVYRVAEKYKKAVSWLADWKEREKLESWMMINVALSLLQTRGIREAGPVHKFAADELPVSNDTFIHHACAAFYESCYGTTAEAQRHLDEAEYGMLSDFYQFIYKLGEGLSGYTRDSRLELAIFLDAMRIYPDFPDHVVTRKLWLKAVRQTFPALICSGPRCLPIFGKSIACILRGNI